MTPFRGTFVGGRVVVTQGVQALDAESKAKRLSAVREFNEFTEDNDSHGEHDFGAINQNGKHYFWKIN